MCGFGAGVGLAMEAGGNFATLLFRFYGRVKKVSGPAVLRVVGQAEGAGVLAGKFGGAEKLVPNREHVAEVAVRVANVVLLAFAVVGVMKGRCN